MDKNLRPEASFRDGLDLVEGETIVWRGRPRPGLYLGIQNYLILIHTFLLISLIALGFYGNYALFVQDSRYTLLLVFLLLMLSIPLLSLSLKLLYRNNTVYYITNLRIVLVTGVIGQHAFSISLDGITQYWVNEYEEGYGDIRFDEQYDGVSYIWGERFGKNHQHPVFAELACMEMVEDVRQVAEIIRVLRKKGE